jgi:predicted peptidase
MSKISFLFAFIVMTTTSLAQDSPEFEKLVFQNTKDTIPYRLLKPMEVKENQQYPLVIFLHGMGERGNDNIINLKYITSLFLDENNRTEFPCYVAVPQCPITEKWTYPDWYRKPQKPISTVMSLIDSLKTLPTIDANRIYIMGLSMGGYGTWYLLTHYPSTFAAAVPICGGGDPRQVENFRTTPVWAFHGAEDITVPVEESRNMIEALRKVGANPKYTEYKKVGHNSWTPAFQEPQLLPWLFSQQLLK